MNSVWKWGTVNSHAYIQPEYLWNQCPFLKSNFQGAKLCQNCRSKPPFCSCCFSESRDSPAVSLLSSTCLLPVTALCSLWEGTLMPAAPLRDSQPHCWQPWPALPWSQWCPSGLACLVLSSPALSRLWARWQGDLWSSHPRLTQAGSGIHIPLVPWSARVSSCSSHNGRE